MHPKRPITSALRVRVRLAPRGTSCYLSEARTTPAERKLRPYPALPCSLSHDDPTKATETFAPTSAKLTREAKDLHGCFLLCLAGRPQTRPNEETADQRRSRFLLHAERSRAEVDREGHSIHWHC